MVSPPYLRISLLSPSLSQEASTCHGRVVALRFFGPASRVAAGSCQGLGGERDGTWGQLLDLETDLVGEGKNVKKRNTMKYELLWLGDGSGSLSGVSGPRLRGIGGFNKTNIAKTKKRVRDAPKDPSGLGKGKRWVELDFEGAADP